MAEMKMDERERLIPPHSPSSEDHRIRIRIGERAWMLVEVLAKLDQRPVEQWLSRFVPEALEKWFVDEANKYRASKWLAAIPEHQMPVAPAAAQKLIAENYPAQVIALQEENHG